MWGWNESRGRDIWFRKSEKMHLFICYLNIPFSLIGVWIQHVIAGRWTHHVYQPVKCYLPSACWLLLHSKPCSTLASGVCALTQEYVEYSFHITILCGGKAFALHFLRFPLEAAELTSGGMCRLLLPGNLPSPNHAHSPNMNTNDLWGLYSRQLNTRVLFFPFRSLVRSMNGGLCSALSTTTLLLHPLLNKIPCKSNNLLSRACWECCLCVSQSFFMTKE